MSLSYFPLRAGTLSCQFDPADGALRWIKSGEVELWRGLYVAVRDANWGTVAPRLTWIRRDVEADSFALEFEARCEAGDIQFEWRGRVSGAATGEIVYEMDGAALSDFRRNRIGFCLLHPMEVAGARCRLHGAGERPAESVFPRAITPHQPFFDLRGLDHEWQTGAWACARFEGEVFEAEDQRNWTDASFKTYCTPLARPFPVEIGRGERVWQRVVLSLEDAVPDEKPGLEEGASPALDNLGEGGACALFQSGFTLPALGLGVAPLPHSPAQIKQLRALRPAHLRVDVLLAGGDFSAFDAARALARELGAPLEVALLGNADDFEKQLSAFAAHLRAGALPLRVARWLVFEARSFVSPPAMVRAARRMLTGFAPDARFGGGSNANFAELNRAFDAATMGAGELDFVSFAVNPQVHAFDDATLCENAGALGVCVEAARALGGGTPIIVSPVTLKPRFNAVATTSNETAPASGIDPATVDARQSQLVGAAYTLGALASLLRGEAESATFYETCGPRGVVPESLAGNVFPLFHVLAEAGEWMGASVQILESGTSPVQVTWLALAGERAIWLWNASAHQQEIRVALPADVRQLRVRVLDETTLSAATTEPETWRAERVTLAVEGEWRLALRPYAFVRADVWV